ncbi:MAG: cell division protein ZapA [Bdellovibrionales bacterium]|nr:cell division protein ZapA [Bdellovibrionales bacterium]
MAGPFQTERKHEQTKANSAKPGVRPVVGTTASRRPLISNPSGVNPGVIQTTTEQTGADGSRARSFQVSIAGVPLRLRSSHDEETVNELVRLVDTKIGETLPLTKTGSIQNASILAALNLAEELLLLKRRAKELVDGLEARAARVIEDLEKSGPTA